ncbi:MAG: hypothetical protein K0S97_2407, partial [Chloroflexota bacterium]|nr:hypothetical protein [Chloroflexota bacterium]
AADIYASGLETGSDLESLFLELTGGEASTSREGSFVGGPGNEASTGNGPDGTTGGGAVP